MKVLRFAALLLTLALFFSRVTNAQVEEDFQPKSIDRLFLTPCGKVLPSMEVNLTLGGAYGTMNRGEYLGIAAVGLGNVAELEISTWRLVSNFLSGTLALGTTSLKISLLKETDNTPGMALTFRSNPSWAKMETSGQDLSSEISAEVTKVSFETHFAGLYLTVSKQLFTGTAFNAGLSLTDMRTRSGSAIMITAPMFNEFPDQQVNLLGGYIGFSRLVNSRTTVMGELSTIPRFSYDPEINDLSIDQVALIIAGFRFYFSPNLSTDAGVKYRTDYAGIADAEISVGLNAGFNLQDLLRK